MTYLKFLLPFTLAAGTLAGAAYADTPVQPGHWKWVVINSPGPRAPLPTRRRIWIADSSSQLSSPARGMTAEKRAAPRFVSGFKGLII